MMGLAATDHLSRLLLFSSTVFNSSFAVAAIGRSLSFPHSNHGPGGVKTPVRRGCCPCGVMRWKSEHLKLEI